MVGLGVTCWQVQPCAFFEFYPPMKLGPWSNGERFWVKHRSFLLLRGYRLRPRFDPQWAAENLHETAPITGEHWSLGVKLF